MTPSSISVCRFAFKWFVRLANQKNFICIGVINGIENVCDADCRMMRLNT